MVDMAELQKSAEDYIYDVSSRPFITPFFNPACCADSYEVLCIDCVTCLPCTY